MNKIKEIRIISLKRIPIHSKSISILSVRLILFCILFLTHTGLYAQEPSEEIKQLKALSLEELLEIEVFSVSKRSEKLVESPSAIQVVSDEDIERYGATNIPEALYLAGNLQVAQSASSSWKISSRGFNTETANKLLVLMDGRSVYTPLYGGVFWERQDYLLEDLEQIEVISGPGGTLWGVNAVNGVINITSKSAEETQGLYVEGSTGNELKTSVGLRYGAKIGSKVSYRVYGKYANRDATVFPDSVDNTDDWKMAQGGFRVDADPNETTHVTLQGDLYDNYLKEAEGDPGVVGGNTLVRFTKTFSDTSSMRIQSYYDRTVLRIPTEQGTFIDDLTTMDIEFQHRFKPGVKHDFVWGLGYRFTHDDVTNVMALGFEPEDLDQNLYTVFAQDEIHLFRNFYWTVGSKLEHNAYVGFVVEPSTRIRWNMNDHNVLWAAVSRAVRAPSRTDRDLRQDIAPGVTLLSGNSDFRSETVVSWEAGIRNQLGDRVTTSFSLFYNQYDDIRSAVTHPETIIPITFENGVEGKTYGLEFTLNCQMTSWWQVFASYNFLEEDLKVEEGKEDINNARNEVADPQNQFSIRSSFLLPHRLSINPSFRWVDDLIITEGSVPSYSELNAKISWEATDNIAISLVGRNLLNDYHVEYGFANRETVAIQRSIYGKAIFRF
ncbi:TonB-dependent receptor [Reichenbachiella sp. MALMAid0571]|uniref:TonB-dependent receptor plug domain-containing protein n=1 Tax=Reichenbachiella sp. MALMAid0571 TaxID=3143939 RepID=UPI0032E00422